MKGSFAQTPLNRYSPTLSPDTTRFSSFRVFPSFISAQAFPASFLASFTTTVNQQTVITKLFSSQLIFNGFSFVLKYAHKKTTILKKDLTAHSIITYVPKYKSQIKLQEVNGNGEIFLTVSYGDRGTIVSRTDSFEVDFKAPKLSNVRLENCQVVYKFTNHTYELSKYLPDFGGRICL